MSKSNNIRSDWSNRRWSFTDEKTGLRVIARAGIDTNLVPIEVTIEVVAQVGKCLPFEGTLVTSQPTEQKVFGLMAGIGRRALALSLY